MIDEGHHYWLSLFSLPCRNCCYVFSCSATVDHDDGGRVEEDVNSGQRLLWLLLFVVGYYCCWKLLSLAFEQPLSL